MGFGFGAIAILTLGFLIYYTWVKINRPGLSIGVALLVSHFVASAAIVLKCLE